MKRCLFLFSLSLMVVLTAGLFVAGPVQAAESRPLNLITSPLPINLSTEPGKTVTADLRVKQGGDRTERLRVSLMKFGAFGEEGKPRLLDPEPGDEYFQWVSFDKSVFDAPGNVWQTVKMTITVPKSAAFGYYYAVVFSRVGDDRVSGGNVNAIHGGSAVLVLLDAKVPNAKRELKVESITSERGLYEFLPANFKVKLANTGNVHMVPRGNIFITKGDKPIATLNFNGERGNILPGSKRLYPVEWTDGFPHFEKVLEDGRVKLDGKGKPVWHLVWSNGSGETKGLDYHLRMGHYTAHLFAVYDDGRRDVPLEATVGFWVVPWKFFLSVIIGLIVLYLIIRFALHKYKQRIETQVRRQYRQ